MPLRRPLLSSTPHQLPVLSYADALCRVKQWPWISIPEKSDVIEYDSGSQSSPVESFIHFIPSFPLLLHIAKLNLKNTLSMGFSTAEKVFSCSCDGLSLQDIVLLP